MIKKGDNEYGKCLVYNPRGEYTPIGAPWDRKRYEKVVWIMSNDIYVTIWW